MPSWMVEFKLPPTPESERGMCPQCNKHRVSRWVSSTSQRFSDARCYLCTVELSKLFASHGVTDVKVQTIGAPVNDSIVGGAAS